MTEEEMREAIVEEIAKARKAFQDMCAEFEMLAQGLRQEVEDRR